MPIPLILGAAAIGAGLLGLGAHADAKEKNERAEDRAYDAQELINSAKRSLEKAQKKTEESLLNLGYSKKEVLETSMKQFLIAYDRIKHIELSDSVGLDEIKNFTIEKQDTLQIKEMSDIYEAKFASGVAGAATGTAIVLATSGSVAALTTAASSLSLAGSCLAIGEASSAAFFAGSALSVAAAPLAAIAAPIALFTGISASSRADENLSKANAMYAEAELAAEKMYTSRTLCYAIVDRSDMFTNLLNQLNDMFTYCAGMLDGMTRAKMGFFSSYVDARKFTKDELKLVAVTRALAGAIKAVIDAPILNSDGQLSDESEEVYDMTSDKMIKFDNTVNEIKNCNFNVKPIEATTATLSVSNASTGSSVRNIFALVSGIAGYFLFQGFAMKSTLLGLMVGLIITLSIMQGNTINKFFRFINKLCSVVLAIDFIMLFVKACPLFMSSISVKNVIIDIVVVFLSFVLAALTASKDMSKISNFRKTMCKLFRCIMFFAVGLVLFAGLSAISFIPHTLIVVVVTIIYGFVAISTSFMDN